MVKISFSILLLSAAIATSGCGGTKVPSQPIVFKGNTVCESHMFKGVVLLAAENVGQTDFSSLWSPSTNIVNEATDKISDYLRNAPAENAWQTEDLREIRGRLSKTFCQAVGITFNGKKAILLNCLSSGNSYVTNFWQKHFIKVYDGGAHYWNIIYIPENGSFTNLQVNGIV